jgi:hypothetical protein
MSDADIITEEPINIVLWIIVAVVIIAIIMGVLKLTGIIK